MTELDALYKLLGGWRSLLGIAGTLILGVLLVIQKGETRHWTKQSNRFEQLYHQDQAAFTTTVANYRAAAAKAKADDEANAARVLAEQQAINERTSQSYEARLADAHARAERLQQLAAASANPSSPSAAGVPSGTSTAGGPSGPAPQAGLSSSDALTATEQAIQLDELIKWVKSTVGIDRTGTPSSQSSPTTSH